MAASILGMAFVPYYNHLMKLLETSPELKKTAKGILHQVMYGAVGTAIGGAVGGPPGALLGGICGSVAGYYTVDPYDNLIKVLRCMDEEEKQKLVEQVQGLVGSTSLEALTTFIQSQAKRELLIHMVRTLAEQSKKG